MRTAFFCPGNKRRLRLWRFLRKIWPVVLVSGCLPLLDMRKTINADFTPPALVAWEVLSEREVRLDFNEEVKPQWGGSAIDTNSQQLSLSAAGKSISLFFDPPMEPGIEQRAAVGVSDGPGNRLELVLSFYGYNPDIPELLINEIRLEGSSTRPDLVEFVAKSSGNLAGAAFYRGIPADYDFMFIFPPVEVVAGDFILLHVAPEGLAVEVNEKEHYGVSGGREACDQAWDFWLPQKEGLSATNGVLTLCSAPGGRLLDLVAYSNRTALSDTKYGGFGSRTNLTRAQWAQEQGGWKFDSSEPRPEELIDPVPGTSTRTICRSSDSKDSNRKEDWHIVPNGMCSFGRKNSDEKYEAP